MLAACFTVMSLFSLRLPVAQAKLEIKSSE